MQNFNNLLKNFNQNQLKEINDFLNSSQGRQLKSKINSADKNALLKEFQKIDPNVLNSKLKGMSKDDILKIINGL